MKSFSTAPLDCGRYGAILEWSMPRNLNVSFIAEERKLLPLSESISRGTDNLDMIFSRTFTVTSAVVVLRGAASGYWEPRSMYVRLYLFLDLVIGKGPTMSIAILSNGRVMWGGGDTIGALECVRLAVFWQQSQDWQVALTSVARWDQKKCLRILYLVRLWPPCPAIGVEWAKSSTCWRRLAGRTICQIGSPSRSADCRWRMPCLVIYGEFSWSAEDQGSASVGSLCWSLRRASESALGCERGSKSGSDEGSVSVSGRDRFVCGKSKSSPMISG